jgi:hypothetical protein
VLLRLAVIPVQGTFGRKSGNIYRCEALRVKDAAMFMPLTRRSRSAFNTGYAKRFACV